MKQSYFKLTRSLGANPSTIDECIEILKNRHQNIKCSLNYDSFYTINSDGTFCESYGVPYCITTSKSENLCVSVYFNSSERLFDKLPYCIYFTPYGVTLYTEPDDNTYGICSSLEKEHILNNGEIINYDTLHKYFDVENYEPVKSFKTKCANLKI